MERGLRPWYARLYGVWAFASKLPRLYCSCEGAARVLNDGRARPEVRSLPTARVTGAATSSTYRQTFRELYRARQLQRRCCTSKVLRHVARGCRAWASDTALRFEARESANSLCIKRLTPSAALRAVSAACGRSQHSSGEQHAAHSRLGKGLVVLSAAPNTRLPLPRKIRACRVASQTA